MDLPPDFRELLEELGRARVEFLIVGGYAVAFHGRPRATKDLDLLLRGTPENLERTRTALDAFGAGPNILEAIRTMQDNEIVYMGTPPMRVDFLRTIEGVSTEAAFANGVHTVLDGIAVAIIQLDDLIANKRAVGRPRDIDDAKFLERVRAKRQQG